MAVAAFKSTTRRQCDIRGVEIEGSPVYATLARSMNRSPTRRSMSRNPSPTRRSMSRAPSPTKDRRRSLSKAPSPTRGRRGVSREPTARRSLSKAPSPTRRVMSRVASPPKDRRRSESVSRNPSPTRGRRGVSRGSSPTRGRRGVSRGPSPTRGRSFRAASRGPSPTRGRRGVSREPTARVAATPARGVSRPTSPSRRMSTAGLGSREAREASPEKPAARLAGRVLRRTQSSAELALSQFLADASVVSGSPPAIAARQSGIGLRGSPARSSRTLPSDSESEVEPRYTRRRESESEQEPRYARRLDRSFSSRRDSSDNESVQSSRSAIKRQSGLRHGSLRRSSTMQHEIRRSLTNLDMDTSTPVYYQKPKPVAPEDHRHVVNDDREVQGEEKTIEEKTIQEVHTQAVVQTLCYNCLYDVSASADVTADAVSPIGAVKMKGLGNSREAPPGDMDFVALYNARCAEVRRAVNDARVELENVKEDALRKVIEAKLELSEKKVSELWSQYATEERRCLHLVRSVKDINEGSGDLDVDEEIGLEVTLPKEQDLKPHNHRYPLDDMDETDFTRQSLDEEAARYFEECAIIANFDANVADDISVSSSRVSDGETTVNDTFPPSRRQSSDSQEFTSARKKQIAPLGDEGMLLPWLDWEPEVDLGRKERLEKAVADFRKWKSSWARKSVEWVKSSNRERGKDEGAVNVDEFIFERTRLQSRIAQGRMLVCGGKR